MRYKIKDVAKINERAINKKYNGTINYIDTSSVTDNIFNNPKVYSSIKEAPSRARRVANLGDTIISTVRPNMKHTGFIDKVKYKNCIYSTGFAVVTPLKDRVDPFYLYLVLTNNKNTELLQNIGETSTSTYPSVKPSDIENLEHDFPSINEQKEISTTIKMLENKIYLNNKINTNLLAIAKEKYQKMLASSLLTKTKLKDFATITMGQSPSSKTYNKEKQGVALLNGATDFRNGIHPSKWTTDPKKVVNKGAYIFGVRATIGLTTKVFNKYAIGRGTGSAVSKDTTNDEFLYFVLNDIFKDFKNTGSGSVYINISKKDLNEYTFYKPKINELISFHQTIAPIMNKIYTNNQENIVLTEIKENLLKQFF